MNKFSRNKLVSIVRKADDVFAVHGILDDDIYSLRINFTISISDLEILTIQGHWVRWTTSQCPRADNFLQEAVGMRIKEGFAQQVHRIIGRKACRHYANILLECCAAVEEAAIVARWEDARSESPKLTLEQFLNGEIPANLSSPAPLQTLIPSSGKDPKKSTENKLTEFSGGMLIDLHVHTAPASPCSSAPLKDIIEEAKRAGLDGICLTDHNYVWSRDIVEDLRQTHQFLILRGNEITTDQGDILVFGLERDIKGIIKLQDLREEVIREEGFMIVAHPFRGFLAFGADQLGLTAEKAGERSLFQFVDGVETMNGKVTDKENSLAADVAKNLKLPATGGSDAHEVHEVGVFVTRFRDTINNEKDLVKALKGGAYVPLQFRKRIGQ